MPKNNSTKADPNMELHPYARHSSSDTTSPSITLTTDTKPLIPTLSAASATPSTSPQPSKSGPKPKPKPKPGSSTPNPPTKPTRRTNTATQPWSGPELLAVFHHALKSGPSGSDSAWEGVVPGRTGNSIRLAWRQRVKPMMEAFLLSQGK